MNYSRHSINDKEIKAITKTMLYGSLTMGKTVEEFEKAVCDYIGCDYAIAVGNATEALHLALLAHGIGRDDEVITSPFTFVATVNAIVMTGAKPVFIDVTKWGNICLNEVIDNINSKTKAILVVDYAGYPVNYRPAQTIINKPELIWIRDAAHSFGAEILDDNFESVRVGSKDTACFSFHPCKTITTAEGGMIVTDNKAVEMKARAMRAHGIFKNNWKQDMVRFGYNYKMTDMQASIGLEQLKKIDDFWEKRQKIAYRYEEELSDIADIELMRYFGQVKHSWHLFPILIPNRDKVIQKLWDEEICCGIHYKPVHLHSWYRKNFGYREGDFPNAEYLYEHIMSLPIYPDLTYEQQSFVISTLKKVLIEERLEEGYKAMAEEHKQFAKLGIKE